MTPGIRATLDRTTAHLWGSTLAGLTCIEATALLEQPALCAHAEAVLAQTQTGNVAATQAACQAWNRAVKAEVLAQYPQRCRAPGTPVGWPHQWVTDGTGTFCLRCTQPQAALPPPLPAPMHRRTRKDKAL